MCVERTNLTCAPLCVFYRSARSRFPALVPERNRYFSPEPHSCVASALFICRSDWPVAGERSIVSWLELGCVCARCRRPRRFLTLVFCAGVLPDMTSFLLAESFCAVPGACTTAVDAPQDSPYFLLMWPFDTRELQVTLDTESTTVYPACRLFSSPPWFLVVFFFLA